VDSAVATYDPRLDVLADMARDPEGHFHSHISGDRRLPPWFGSDEGSLPPVDIRDRLYRFIDERCPGQVAGEYDIRHNWVDRQFEFCRWIPDWEVQDDAGRIALVTWTPLTLQVWDDPQGWLPGGEALFDYLWRCLLTNDADTRREKTQRAELAHAEEMIGRMSSLVSQGVATEAQLEEYEHYLKIADPQGWQTTYELAEEMQKPTRAVLDELGI
jgi:hypothetical protein